MKALDLVQSVAVADALGAPYEEKIPGSVPLLPRGSFLAAGTDPTRRESVSILGGHAPYGSWTDDTQIVLMTCDAIRRSPHDPVPAYCENLLAWERGAFTPSGRRLDAGAQTRVALRAVREGTSTPPTRSSGNGCLMVAIGVHAMGRGEHLERLVRTTHNSDKAASDAAALLEMLRKSTFPRVSRGEISVTAPTGFSEDTLMHAIYRVQDASTCMEGIDRILSAGGDTDSIAAVYAALSVTQGRPAPAALQRSLVGRDVIAVALGVARDGADAPTAHVKGSPTPRR